MSLYRYKAIPANGEALRGEVAADSPVAARAALRSAGLRVVDLRPIRSEHPSLPALKLLTSIFNQHTRRRRGRLKAELFDSVSTLLESGLPLLEAINSSGRGNSRIARHMLAMLSESLRDGRSLSIAMADHPGWFDQAEIAMIESGQHRGDLPAVLASLAERHERSGELAAKFVGTLTYPFVVSIVGLGVVVFLSTKTLPQLTELLLQASVETPRLTIAVMAVGQTLASWWWLVIASLAGGALAVVALAQLALKRGSGWVRHFDRVTPRVMKRLLVARMSGELAEMTAAGVPVTEALRVIAPTFGPPFGIGLRQQIEGAVDRIERGDSIADALSDSTWFDPQFTALLVAGQASGELDSMLARLARRETRRAHRLVDRLASLLEPAVILLLAFMVGTVAMAAILPLIRLQEAM